MRKIYLLAAVGGSLCMAAAEEPQTTLRSTRNAVSMESAPASVARGGILAVFGTELAAAHTIAESYPLPLALEDPAVEVLVNGVPVPLFFVSPTQVNAQVPWETATGWAEVIVRRNGVHSTAMPVNIVGIAPNLFTSDGSSSLIVQSGDSDGGLPLPINSPAPAAVDALAPVGPGDTISVFAAGLGQPDSPVDSGAVGSGAAPAAQQRAYLGGVPLQITSTSLSDETPGVYELQFTVPSSGELGEVLHWYSGNPGGRAILGAVRAATPRYMAVPAALDSPQRIDMSELSPHFVAVSGPLDEEGDFCYSKVQLLDFRRETAQTLESCILPTYPEAEAAGAYRPFEVATNTPVLAALPSAEGDFSGQTNQLLLIDTSSDSPVQTITLTNPADRLQSSGSGNPALRLLRHDGENLYSLVSPDGTEAGEVQGWTPIANPPVVAGLDGFTRIVAQGITSPAWGGYRIQFLGPGPESESGRATAVLFDRGANVVAQETFPEGWNPISPPRRLNNQGSPVGASLAPATTGFRGDRSVFVAARSADGTTDAIVTFRAALPEDTSVEAPASATLDVSVTEFPVGSHAATCHPQVRWQRMPLTSSLAIVATSEVLTEFANPRDGQICTGDQLVIFDTETSSIKAVSAPGQLDNSAKGTLLSYLYFADGGREIALEAPEKLYIFDGVEETFKSIEFPEDVGIAMANATQVQRFAGTGRIVALATGGPTRENPRTGAILPPLPGNRGLLAVDLPEGTFTHFALPDGFQNVHAGQNNLFQQGRRTFGVLPLVGRAFAIARRPNAGPGNPGGSTIVTWDVGTGEATALSVPDEGLFVGQRLGGGRGAGPRPFLWDYSPKSQTFAYGVFNRGGDVVAIGVVGP